jgi:large subunit ribosomal protein L6
MSRVGKKIIPVPAGVELKSDGATVRVKGPKGENSHTLPDGFRLSVEGESATIVREREDPQAAALHGLSRALVANMVHGVSQGFTRVLEIQGMGYKAELKGRTLELQLGFSHLVVYPVPEGIDARCESPTRIVLSGIDKGKVGQAAANVRAFRPPEPYKGKGIRYEGEAVRRKAGKSAATGA